MRKRNELMTSVDRWRRVDTPVKIVEGTTMRDSLVVVTSITCQATNKLCLFYIIFAKSLWLINYYHYRIIKGNILLAVKCLVYPFCNYKEKIQVKTETVS